MKYEELVSELAGELAVDFKLPHATVYRVVESVLEQLVAPPGVRMETTGIVL